MKVRKRLRWIAGLIFLLSILCLILFVGKGYGFDGWAAWGLLVIFAVFFVLADFSLENNQNELRNDIEQTLDQGMKAALEEARVGILVYNDDFRITWMSDFMISRSLDHIGEKLFEWLPETQNLVDGECDETLIVINEEKYEVSKKKNANVMIFRDVTQEYDLKARYENDAVVLGLISLDNYEEVSELEEDLAYVNTNIRPMIYEYCKDHSLVYKTLRNSRILLILNEKKFAELREDSFSILAGVRKEAKKGEIDMTLSIAFARGSDDLEELDHLAMNLLEIAQTRGGDQVIARKIGEEAVFYGGNSEARGKRSKVRVRVIANTLKSLLRNTSNVIICGHQDADADCIGSALCLSTMIRPYVNSVCIITKSGGLEAMIGEVLKENREELASRHDFVSESEAINRLKDDSLVIMVDHHTAATSNGCSLLQEAKRIVIIDHHRRKADLDTKPLMTYIEAGASSASELTAEFIPYLLKQSYVQALEANIMYLGMVIDTNHFRVRTGERTFDVASSLRQYGADPSLADKWQREPFKNIQLISEIIDHAQKVKDRMVICAMDNKDIYSRSIISQACDRMMQTKDVDAGFVIAYIDEGEMAISARSNGAVNVQLIMEKMNGGGHLTGAGVQRKEGTIESLQEELLQAINEYLEEEKKENESNSVE